MNEIQAREAGYEFTGAYSRNKDEMKERAKRERAIGNKAVVVEVRDSKYTRGPRGIGYAVYRIESEANKALRLANEKAAKIQRLKNELQKAKAKVLRLNTLLAELEES